MLRQKGFTLIELMITIAVLAIVLGMAIPAFNQMVANQRTSTLSNELITAIQLARSEAVTRRSPVILCPAANDDFDECKAGETAWHETGWLIVVPDDPEIDDDVDQIIKVWQPNDRTEVIADAGSISFTAKGYVASDSATEFVINQIDCPAEKGRMVTVELTRLGQVSRRQESCN